jgi:hypothetical protein
MNQSLLHILAGLPLSKEPVLRNGQRIKHAKTILAMNAKRKFPAHASK